MLSDEQNWISTKELAELKNITERGVRKSLPKSNYITRKNGKSYEILINSLEKSLIDKLKTNQMVLKKETLSSTYEEIKQAVPQKAKELALAKFDLIQNWINFKNKSENNKTQAGKDFLLLYNQNLLCEEIFKKIGKVAIGTIYEWHKKLKDNDNKYECLICNYQYGEKIENVGIKPFEENIFKRFLLSDKKFSIGKSITLTKYYFQNRGIDNLSCAMTYRRYANKYKRNHFDIWTLARNGEKALRDSVLPSMKRDISKLEVGEVLIADGHRLAVQVINPFTGQPTRATLVGYQDWKSTALVGFEIMLEENTQCIASALRNSIINLGKIPDFCYQDNGKAFKANYFVDSGLAGLFYNLDIQPIYAKPYNAKAKPIERFFREFQDSFERMLPSFVGSSIENKPAYMSRNEKLHKSLHNNYIPTIEELFLAVNKWLNFHYAQPCPNVKDRTIGEVLNSGRGSGVDVKRLDDLMMAREVKTIGKNGIRFLKSDYYDETLYGFRDRVIVKYSLFDLSSIKVYKTDGEFLCVAKRVKSVHPLANYTGTPKDMEEFKQQAKQQKQLEKKTVQKYLKEIKKENLALPMMEEEPLFESPKVKMAEFKELVKQEKPIEINGRPIFVSDIDRYEWLRANTNKVSDADKKWIEKYQKTDEYLMIYINEERSAM